MNIQLHLSACSGPLGIQDHHMLPFGTPHSTTRGRGPV